jgi:hypothetical protein
VTTPIAPADRLLVAPYVTVPEFRAAPTWIDSDDLIPGGTADKQDDELYNVLLRASAWADNEVNPGFGLGASAVTEQLRARTARDGTLAIHPSKTPVRQVTALAYGASPSNLADTADLSGVWIEDGRQILAAAATGGNWAAAGLEFGSARPGGRTYVRITYTAGYATTVLAADATAGASQVTVTDPAGIFPGDVLRIWDPGLEEAVTVAAGYTPGSTTVPLAGVLVNAHTTGAGLSGLPAEVKQAVITYAVALLMRDDVSSEEPFADSEFGPAARRSDTGGRAGGLVSDAENLLRPYRRVT